MGGVHAWGACFLAHLTKVSWNIIMKNTTITLKTIMKLGASKNEKPSQAAKKSRIPFKEQQTTQIILNNIVRELEFGEWLSCLGTLPFDLKLFGSIPAVF